VVVVELGEVVVIVVVVTQFVLACSPANEQNPPGGEHWQGAMQLPVP